MGSAVAALLQPKAADMVATLGETTGEQALSAMRDKLRLSEEGTRMLEEKPVITSRTLLDGAEAALALCGGTPAEGGEAKVVVGRESAQEDALDLRTTRALLALPAPSFGHAVSPLKSFCAIARARKRERERERDRDTDR